MNVTKVITPPTRVKSADVLDGLRVLRDAGIVAGVREQANDKGDRRWLVKLATGEVVSLGAAQAWAFLMGASVAVGRSGP